MESTSQSSSLLSPHSLPLSLEFPHFPCPYLHTAHTTTPEAENFQRNSVRNLEMLATNIALEELRHWLERTEEPFLIWIDHYNLEYIHKAKQLNSRQERWTLFFTRHNFTLSYHPGFQMGKVDAMLQQLETILLLLTMARWRGMITRWSQPSSASHLRILPVGPSTFYGWNTPTILFLWHLLASPFRCVYGYQSVFQHLRRRFQLHLSPHPCLLLPLPI